ncbi:MAG: AMP-binding protein [Planctomycetes bacterium]|nr:AMP-binding protein [Planctomycetota bacterium]
MDTAVKEPSTQTTANNVAMLLVDAAAKRPDATAIIEQKTGREITFGELAKRIANVAEGLHKAGIKRGTRTVLAVKPSIEFFEGVFGLFHAGAVPIVVDPGMGRKNLLACIKEAEPEALLGISAAHALSKVFRFAFRTVNKRVTVGGRWFWGGASLSRMAQTGDGKFPVADTSKHDLAAILFTSGSTGIPKGVKYQHGMFVGQTQAIQDTYGIKAGEIDVPCFALFALFSVAMGVTVVLPEMDMSNPASVDPAKIVAAIKDNQATMSFGSPAVWKKLGPWLQERDIKLPSVKRILIAGAPVPYSTLAMFEGRLAEGGDLFTPYGATESLPLSSISASEILGETAAKTTAGKGTCVGQPLELVECKVIRLTENAIADISDIEELGVGEIGEIIVKSPVTTQEYFQRPEQTKNSKILDSTGVKPLRWHRMGDTGYFDAQGRLWFCGRVSHRVETSEGVMYPIQVEAIFNNHDAVNRCALVGVGDRPNQQPVMIIELNTGDLPPADLKQTLTEQLLKMAELQDLTRQVKTILFHKSLPVDVRHNAKINREVLAAWASGVLL